MSQATRKIVRPMDTQQLAGTNADGAKTDRPEVVFEQPTVWQDDPKRITDREGNEVGTITAAAISRSKVNGGSFILETTGHRLKSMEGWGLDRALRWIEYRGWRIG